MNPETPKKSVPKKGRKRKGEEASQFCRVCYRPFVIAYGNFPSSKTGYISTENIFTVPQKKGLTKPLSSYLEDLGFHLESGEQFSTRVCSPCGTKVRAAATTVYLLKTNLNQPAPSISVVQNEVNERSKRMSKSPHQTQQKKMLRSSSPPKKSAAKRSLCLPQDENISGKGLRRSLASNEVFQAIENTTVESSINDEITTLAHETQQKAELTVLVKDANPIQDYRSKAHPKSGTEVKDETPVDPAVCSLIKNVVKKNWKTVSNILVMKIKEAKPYVQQAVRKVIDKEFANLCKVGRSILRKRAPKELVEFSNEKLAQEVSTECPMWNSCLVGACGINENIQDAGNTNSIAVATAVVAKRRHQRMSAFAYRISSILMHSGAKEADFTRLNRLGLCMSHKETLVKQKEMGKHYDEKVQTWRGEAILRNKAASLIDEVSAKQDESSIKMTVELAKDCSHYSDEAFNLCRKVFADKSQENLTKESLQEAKLEVLTGPLYRYLNIFPFSKLV